MYMNCFCQTLGPEHLIAPLVAGCSTAHETLPFNISRKDIRKTKNRNVHIKLFKFFISGSCTVGSEFTFLTGLFSNNYLMPLTMMMMPLD